MKSIVADLKFFNAATKMGTATFLFFALKGIAWLTVPGLVGAFLQ